MRERSSNQHMHKLIKAWNAQIFLFKKYKVKTAWDGWGQPSLHGCTASIYDRCCVAPRERERDRRKGKMHRKSCAWIFSTGIYITLSHCQYSPCICGSHAARMCWHLLRLFSIGEMDGCGWWVGVWQGTIVSNLAANTRAHAERDAMPKHRFYFPQSMREPVASSTSSESSQ